MIASIDHVVLTVADIDRAVRFYTRVLGMQDIRFGEGRRALGFGCQKINLQTLGMEQRNHAATGSGDLCLLVNQPLETVSEHLDNHGVTVVEGPVRRSGATGPIMSLYINDPDGNLIELSVCEQA